MASRKDYKAPPTLSEDISYENWKKEIKIWQIFTNVDKKKQAAAIFLTLEGKARDAVLEMNIETLNADNGVDKVIETLDSLFKKDTLQLAFTNYDNFEKFCKTEEMTMKQYVIEFERLHNKAKQYGMELPDGILAYKLLVNARLPEQQERLVKATITELTFSGMKNQLKRIFGDIVQQDRVNVNDIKVEPTYHGSHQYFRGRGRYFRGATNYTRPTADRNSKDNRQRNPVDMKGEVSRCNICGSVFHWQRDCPDSYENRKKKKEEVNVTLYTEVMDVFMGETLSAAVLDSGCSKTVCGESWLKEYLETLSDNELNHVTESQSNTIFKFGDGNEMRSIKQMKLPARIGDTNINIVTDVVKGDLPLLFSKDAMKKAGTKIDFSKDTIEILGMKQKVFLTSSGHYCIPLGKRKFEFDDISSVDAEEIVLYSKSFAMKNDTERLKDIVKLHKQFSHPPPERLKKLLRDAGVEDKKLHTLIDHISQKCETCFKYKKLSPRPVVGLRMSNDFNDYVAMDLKEWTDGNTKTWFLHLIDTFTKYSAATVIHSKRKEVIVKKIFEIWIGTFGCAGKFMVDNGGEFDNSEFIDFCEKLNIRIVTTAAESPWSNGIVERHNAIIGETVRKIMNDQNCELEVALSWAISAKNSLANYNGYSPNQLLFGKNPNIPCILTNKPPAMESKTTSQVVAKNLNAMHAARRAYIENESSEKIRRALRHQIRPSGNVKYMNGDKVYYRRKDDKHWHGPCTVIGFESQQVLVKHGSRYIRVHPCNLMHEKGQERIASDDTPKPETNTEQFMKHLALEDDDVYSENDEDDVDAVTLEEDNVYFEDTENTIEEEEMERNGDDFDCIHPIDEVSKLENVEHNKDVSEQRNVNANNKNDDAEKDVVKLKPKMKIRIATNEDLQLKEVEVISRAGKIGKAQGGKYKDFWNVRHKDGSTECIDMKKGISKIERINEEISPSNSEEILLVDSTETELIKQAKTNELENWIKNNVYEEVPVSKQSLISTRWVITKKCDQSGLVKFKARLVARGFEDKADVQTDSPTCCKESLRIMFAIMSVMNWTCHSIDIKAAFLQGKPIDRELYIRPPKEAYKEGTVWKLKTCVYGLNDASRTWYLKVYEELTKLNVKVCKYDPGLFYWHHNGKLAGIISTHVDDFCWGGSEYFEREVIEEIRKIFQVGVEKSVAFKYLGINLSCKDNEIMLDQISYVNSIQEIYLPKKRLLSKSDGLNDEEKTKMRQLIGQLNWVATQTRPDILFDCCQLMGIVSKATVGDLTYLNKVVCKVKKNDVALHFPSVGNIEEAKLICYSDASYGNLSDGGSQGGYVIFLSNKDKSITIPLAWQSKRVRRVVKSTLSAETLALIEAAESSYWLSSIIRDVVFDGKGLQIAMECYTDCKSLVDAAHSSKGILDRRLRVDIAILKEMIEKKEISKLSWITTKDQMADPLTKNGASSSRLLQAIAEARL